MYPLICVDCRWCLPTPASNMGVYNCKASEKIHLVTGKPEYKYCNVMRLDHEPCGTEGRLFELNIPERIEEGDNNV